MVGPGKPIDTDRFFVICSNVIGGCMGTTGPASTNPATGKPYGLDFPVITIRDMVRAQAMLLDHLGIDSLFCVRRRLDGRHAGAAMGGELSRSASSRRCRSPPAPRHSAQNIAFHEVGRQADHGRSRLARRALPRGRHAPRQGPRGGAHGARTSPICRRRRCTGSSAASCRTATAPTFAFDADFQIESYLRHQGIDLRRALRRQLLSLHHPRDGLFRPRRRPRRRRSPRPSAARRRASASSPSPPTGCSRPPSRAPSCTRSTPPAPRSPSSRSRPTRATTPSCSTSPSCSRPTRGFIDAAARARGMRAERWTRRTPIASRRRATGTARRPPARRRHGRARLARARRRLRRRRAAGAAARRAAASTGAASSCRARASTTASRKGLSVIQGDADTDLADYPDDAFDYVILSQTLQATRKPARRAGAHAAHRPAGDRLVPEFRPLAHARSSSLLRGRMPVTENLPYSWYDTPNIHFCTIRDFVDAVPRGRRQDRARGRARRRRPADPRQRCPGGSGTCSASRRCSCCGEAGPRARTPCAKRLNRVQARGRRTNGLDRSGSCPTRMMAGPGGRTGSKMGRGWATLTPKETSGEARDGARLNDSVAFRYRS